MYARRSAVALVVSTEFLVGAAALAGPRSAAPQAPPVHTWSSLPPAHITRMRPFVAPKRFVYVPYTPLYLPNWGFAGMAPFALGGFGLSSSMCQSAPQTLGELGNGGYSGFAPVTLGGQPFETLNSPALATGSFVPQPYCQTAPLGWSDFSLGI